MPSFAPVTATAHVASRHELQSGAEREAIHAADHRDGAVTQAAASLVHTGDEGPGRARLMQLRQLLNVCAADEGLFAPAGDHHAAQFRVLSQPFHRIHELADDDRVQRIQLGAVVDGDMHDPGKFGSRIVAHVDMGTGGHC